MLEQAVMSAYHKELGALIKNLAVFQKFKCHLFVIALVDVDFIIKLADGCDVDLARKLAEDRIDTGSFFQGRKIDRVSCFKRWI